MEGCCQTVPAPRLRLYPGINGAATRRSGARGLAAPKPRRAHVSLFDAGRATEIESSGGGFGGAGKAEALERRIRSGSRRARVEAADRLAGQRAVALDERHRVGAAAGGLDGQPRGGDVGGPAAEVARPPGRPPRQVREPVLQALARHRGLRPVPSAAVVLREVLQQLQRERLQHRDHFAIPVWAGGRIDDTEARSRASVMRAEAERDAREWTSKSRCAAPRPRSRGSTPSTASRGAPRASPSRIWRRPRSSRARPRRGGPPRRQAHAGCRRRRRRDEDRARRARGAGQAPGAAGRALTDGARLRTALRVRGAADALEARS